MLRTAVPILVTFLLIDATSAQRPGLNAQAPDRHQFGPPLQPTIPKACPVVIALDANNRIDLKALFPEIKRIGFNYIVRGKLHDAQVQVRELGGEVFPVWTGNYIEGDREGRQTLFDDEGRPKVTINYRKEKRNGLAVLLFDGWPTFAATYDMGQLKKAWVVTYKGNVANVAEITPGTLLDFVLPLLEPQVDAWESVLDNGERALARIAREQWREDQRRFLAETLPERSRRMRAIQRQRDMERRGPFLEGIEQQRRNLLWPHGYR